MRDIFRRFHNPLRFHGRGDGRSGKRGRFKLNWKLIWRWAKLGLVAFFFVSAALFAWYSKDLPTPGKIRTRQAVESTKLFDRDGQLLYEVHGEQKRTILPGNEIPEIAKQATLTAEDRQFYNHFGVDFKGLARAVFLDVFTGARVGGSTITQQYVKNALLTNKKSFDRKIRELILALEIEAMFSKDEILAFYLNEIPYGSNNYGIQAAAKSFFGKDAKDLELHEAATLAAIPQAPTYYSPYGTHTDALKVRRDWVLNSMVELGYITREKADEAIGKEISVLPRRDSIEAPHFVFYVREQLVEMFDEQTVEEGGLKVTTTLDLDTQRAATDAIQTGMTKVRQRGGSNAALVSVNPKTGEVLSMVGSYDYFDTEHDGNVNVTLAERQPGSSFKPIVYATGFKGKYSPASTLWDVKTDFGNYVPDNYNGSFSGPVTVRHALANSLNVPAVKMLGLVGLKSALETAHELGITTLNQPERYGLSLVLGGGEVRPLDMATAFSVFANGGTYRPPVSILKIEDSNGKVLFEHKAGKGEKEVLDPAIAFEITSILSDNDARTPIFGPRSALFFPERPVAAKTGTTQEFRDGWTVGYTPSLATAVWVGNNDNTPMKAGADGSVVAAPIFHQYLVKALEGTDKEAFSQPSSVKQVTVDKLSGKLPSASSPELISDWFAPWQVPTEKDDVHVRVKVNKVNGKLASDLTPESLIEERTYTVIHSERPDDPRWENPVLLWAKDRNIETGTPPTEVDDTYTDETLPTVTITSPADGATLSGVITVTANASAAFGVRSVDLDSGNLDFGIDIEAPYSFTIRASDLGGSGQHPITVTVFDQNGAGASQTITVTVVSDATAPGEVSAITATPKSKGATLQWVNPSDSDLERVRIYISTNPSTIGTLYPTELLISPSSISTYTVSDLAGSVKYYFTLRPVDTSGNEAQTTPYSVTTTTLP
ncbi:PBP1A family penicillin-binding protein [Candidatus Berkelbacteria bacterium]|nr:PBP1A family penicillin-binding protein [Candidatus Berkelbacteria bacterium]